MQYFSHFYKLSTTGEEIWLDPRMDRDTGLFIDPFFVFRSEIPTFSNAKQKFLDFFRAAFELAHEAKRSGTALKKLENLLKFPEVMEIRLGLSVGEGGAGPGSKFAKACAGALVRLAEKGYRGLDHFEEIEIFTKGIGPDGISDATANILKYELIQYTQEICEQFSIPTKKFLIDNAQFDFHDRRWDHATFSLPENPCLKNKAVLLVPKEFLCTIHAIGSDGFSEYVSRNKSEELRADLNYEIEKSFSKATIIDIAEKRPEWVSEYIQYVENEANITPYNLEEDEKNLYRNTRKAFDFASLNPIPLSASNDEEFLQFVETIIQQFRLCVEEQGCFKLLWNDAQKLTNSDEAERKPRDENTAQCLFSSIVTSYCQANNIDISREVETGRGPVDFKFSSGYQKRALVELKLAKSSKLKQGRLEQLPAYLRAKQIQHGYYVIIVYRKKEFEKIEKLLEEAEKVDFGDLLFKVVTVDAGLDKPSASNI
ncbi:hypothetical protein [Halomicronema sp. CCY15110]|uniref:hypothetical protein n=1 Tax=Halomicronema sp. CCY15110 TaxID=2767773 RepID=UPI001951FDF4|nr:hypothetical protein [Halomicronema sp. CCY15110]